MDRAWPIVVYPKAAHKGVRYQSSNGLITGRQPISIGQTHRVVTPWPQRPESTRTSTTKARKVIYYE